MSWTRALLACALLALSPLSGVRIVCVVEPQGAGASLGSGDALACQSFCSAHPTRQRTHCALVEDPTCAYALGFAAAILPDPPSLPFPLISEPFDRVHPAAYTYPALDRASPPPKT
jgi:hypothetical protein